MSSGAGGTRDERQLPHMVQSRSSRQEAAKRANALVKGCMHVLQLNMVLGIRFSNQPIMHKVDGQFTGYRRLSGPKGVPDIVAFAPGGRGMLIECKSGSGVVSEHQEAFLDRAEQKGVLCWVIRDVSQLHGYCVDASAVGWVNAISAWREFDKQWRKR